MRPRPRGMRCPSYVDDCRPQPQEGAGKAGRRLTPMVRVQQKSTRQNHRCSRNRPAFPARMAYGLYVLSPGTGSLAPVLRQRVNALRRASAPGRQDHTTSPSVRTPVVCRRSHVHRNPPLRIVTTRTPLFDEAGCRQQTTLSEKTKEKYFRPKALKLPIALTGRRKFPFPRKSSGSGSFGASSFETAACASSGK
jgi:hypothetical protein